MKVRSVFLVMAVNNIISGSNAFESALDDVCWIVGFPSYLLKAEDVPHRIREVLRTDILDAGIDAFSPNGALEQVSVPVDQVVGPIVQQLASSKVNQTQAHLIAEAGPGEVLLGHEVPDFVGPPGR